MQHVLKYHPEEESKKKSFMNQIIAHAKEVPDPRKYSKIITWAKPNTMFTKGLVHEERVTLFDQASRSSKGMPGPATYKHEKSRDKFLLERIKGTYKR